MSLWIQILKSFFKQESKFQLLDCSLILKFYGRIYLLWLRIIAVQDSDYLILKPWIWILDFRFWRLIWISEFGYTLNFRMLGSGSWFRIMLVRDSDFLIWKPSVMNRFWYTLDFTSHLIHMKILNLFIQTPESGFCILYPYLRLRTYILNFLLGFKFFLDSNFSWILDFIGFQ